MLALANEDWNHFATGANMEFDSIVVMESGAAWPAWVDEEAGAISNVVVLARQLDENVREFEARARLRLQTLAEFASPRRGVLVCGPADGPEDRATRGGLLRALLEIVRGAGGGEVVLIGDVDEGLALELSEHVRKLNARRGSQARLVSLRMRPPPQSIGIRRVA
jgi:hypothetical protein